MRRTPYETDAVEWAEQNAELIRARRWEEVDAAHILEELEALGTDRRSARDSYITRIIEHLLKLKYVTGEQALKYNANLWRESVMLHQADLAAVLENNPSLRHAMDRALLDKTYARARRIFIGCGFEHAPEPHECPFGWQEILGEQE